MLKENDPEDKLSKEDQEFNLAEFMEAIRTTCKYGISIC
jgi:hypothetical protein